MLLFFPLFCGTRLPVHRPVFEFSFPTIKNKFRKGKKKKKKKKEKRKKKRRETEKRKTLGGLCVAQHSGGCLVEEINDQSEASKK